MSIPEAADKKPEKKADPAPATAQENSGIKNPFEKTVDVMHPEQNSQLAAAKMLQEVQTGTQAKKGASKYSEKDMDSLIFNSVERASKLGAALDTSYTNESINNSVCKASSTSGKESFNTMLDDYKKGQDTAKTTETGAKSLPHPISKAAEVAAGATVATAARAYGLNSITAVSNVTSDRPMQDFTAKTYSNTELLTAAQAARAKRDAASEVFKKTAEDVMKANPELRISKEGEAVVRRDAQGKEVYRQEGNTTTITENGIKYVNHADSKTKEVIGPDGKVELRMYNNDVFDVPGDNGTALRYNMKTKNAYIVDANGRENSVIINDKGDVVLDLAHSWVKTEQKELDFANPDQVYKDLLAQGQQNKTGIVNYKNGIAIIRRDENDQPEIMVMGKDGQVIVTGDNGSFVVGKGRDWSVHFNDGSDPIPVTDRQAQMLREKYQVQMDQLRDFRVRFTNKDGNTLSLDNNTVRAEVNGTVSTLAADGTRTTTTEGGAVLTTKPNSTETEINNNGARMTLRPGKPPKLQNFDVSTNGTITDLRTGAKLDHDSIRTSKVDFDCKNDVANFSDGVSIDKYGYVSRSSSEANLAANTRSNTQAQEAKAMSMVANAQSMAAEILGKASSGRVTSGDIAALSATLGGLEASVKMLASEVDPSAMLRVMMTKNVVSESLGQAQAMAGKNNQTMAA